MLLSPAIKRDFAENQELAENVVKTLARELSSSIDKSVGSTCVLAILKQCEVNQGDNLRRESTKLLN